MVAVRVSVTQRLAVVSSPEYFAERTFAWFNQFRRLRVRYDKRADIHEALSRSGAR